MAETTTGFATRRFVNGVLAAGAAMLLVLTGAGAASANAKPDPTASAVIGGRHYGPKDGLVVETEQFEITPGGGPVGRVFSSSSGTITPMAASGVITPMITWGSSYAISSEFAQLRYTGIAKAAANVFNGLRIIEVCFWYSRGGTNVSSPRCSEAVSNGSAWRSGPEVSGSVWDSLNPGAPKTIFNISTYRIPPQIL